MGKKRKFYYETRQQVLDRRWTRADTIVFYFDMIDHYLKIHKIKDFEITYTKEKRWRFDITCSWWDDTVWEMVGNLEDATTKICIKCWRPGKLRWKLWRVVPLCIRHYIPTIISITFRKRKRKLKNLFNK